MIERNTDGQTFITSIEELYLLKPLEVFEKLSKASKKPLKELRVFDLSIFEGKPLVSAGGVYLFFDSNNICLYVGKATSRSFIERIPAHFDPRSFAWFTTFPNRVLNKDITTDYPSALNFCANECNLLLLNFNTDEECSKKAALAETYLQTLFQPNLNLLKRKHSQILLSEQTFNEYLQMYTRVL
jgi:hypothetical protein